MLFITGAMKDNGSPPPVSKTDEEWSYFVTILSIHPEAAGGGEEREILTEREIKVLEFSTHAPKKRKEILE